MDETPDDLGQLDTHLVSHECGRDNPLKFTPHSKENTMNIVSLIARIAGEPSTRRVKTRDGETSVTEVRIAIPTSMGRDSKTGFLSARYWRRESLAKFLRKGRLVSVTGQLVTESWKTESGESRSRLVLDVRDIQLLDSPARESKQAPEQGVIEKAPF